MSAAERDLEIIADVLGSARRKGVRLWVENGQLHYRAPKGSMSSEEIDRLKGCKAKIVAFLEAGSHTDTSEPALTRRPVADSAPFTFSQRAHWGRNRLHECSSVRNVASALRLRGRLDTHALRDAVFQVVQRHEALRSRIVIENGVPMQRISPTGECALDVNDFMRVPPQQRESAVMQLIRELILEPIDVTQAPLAAAALAKIGDEEHVLVVALEHLISDAFSVNVVFRDLLATYAQALGHPAQLPSLPAQFGDYAAWQGQQHELWLQRHGSYWKQRLNGATRVRFPIDERLTAENVRGWATVPVRIDREMKARLSDWCRSARTTLVLTVFTAFAALVLRWCRERDVVIRYQTNGRFAPDLANAVGYFAAMLNLRIELDEKDTFATLAERITQEYCRAYEHHDFSYIDAQVPAPEFTHNSCFNWVSKEPSSLLLDEGRSPVPLVVEPLSFVSPLMDIYERDAEPVMLLFESEHEISGGMHYPRNRFTSETMTVLVESFFSLIEALLASPRGLVKDVPIASG